MRIASTKDDISSIFTPSMLACAFAYAALKLAGSVTNGYLYPLVATADGWIREMSTLVVAATFLAITIVAYRKPQVVRAPALVALTCALTLAAMALVGAGLGLHNITLLSLGIFCRSISRALTLCLFALCLVQLESGKQVSFAIALGLFIFSVLDLFRGVIGTPLNAILLLGATQIVVAAWAAKPASRVLDITSAGDSVDDLKLADPTAFLPISHGVFVCILLFSAASGFALTFNEVAGAPPTLLANTPLLALLLLFLLLSWGNKREDVLFTLSVLIVMAGFLTTPLSFNGAFSSTSGTLLRFGQQCFDVLAWTVIAAIGRRNVYGCLVSAGVMQMMSSIGTLIGAVSGHITNDFVATDFFIATGFALTMVFVFFAFLWCGFRTFSFTDAIESVTAVSHPSSGEQGESAGRSPLGRGETLAAGDGCGFARAGDAERTATDAAVALADATTGCKAEGGANTGLVDQLTRNLLLRDMVVEHTANPMRMRARLPGQCRTPPGKRLPCAGKMQGRRFPQTAPPLQAKLLRPMSPLQTTPPLQTTLPQAMALPSWMPHAQQAPASRTGPPPKPVPQHLLPISLTRTAHA